MSKQLDNDVSSTTLVIVEQEDGTIVRCWIGEDEPPEDQVQAGDIWKY